MNPSQKENSGVHAEAVIHDRAGLYVGIVAAIIAAISLGVSLQQPRNIDLQFQLQQQDLQTRNREQAKLIADLTEKVKMLETNVLLYREDVVSLEKKVKR